MLNGCRCEMNEMVERVAKAICKDIDHTEDDWKFMITTALAAIEAIKDYRDNMNAEAEARDTDYKYTLDGMIDAALKDG